MKRSLLRVLLCLAGLLVAVGLAGCGGTETGNPSSGPGSGGGGEKNAAITLVEAVCDKLTVCLGQDKGFTEEDCEEAIAASETLGPAFGVEEEPPPGFGLVIDKVESSELSADEEAVAECVAAIGLLECGDPAVQAVDVEQDFANIEQMIPEASCAEVFSAP